MTKYSSLRIDFSQCPLPPTRHQKIGVKKLIQDPYVFLTDEPGAGKSKQVIDAAQSLFDHGSITRVIVVCPSSVKPVWFDPELGQLRAHCWEALGNRIIHFHRKPLTWGIGPQERPLEWVITNYEFIRAGFKSRSRHVPERLAQLLDLCGPKTLLVLDESSAVKTSRAFQTRACKLLRSKCSRVVLLTGTPVAHSPLDLLSQGNLLHPSILSDTPGSPCTLIQFRTRYAVMGGFQGKQILKWRNLEDLQRRFKPYTLRRLKKDCLDLPIKLDSVALTATLGQKTWTAYKRMRDEMIVQLSEAEKDSVSVAQVAITKLIRLSQITSGFLGGIEDFDGTPLPIKHLSHEKLEVVINWYHDLLAGNPSLKLLIWSRFREECARIKEALEADGTSEIGILWGSSSSEERGHALRLLNPQTAPEGSAVVVGTPSTGSMGINLVSAHHVIYVSNAHSLNVRVQSEDRTHRPGQRHPVNYYDVVATGPDGQKTIDHIVLKALRKRRNLADWTAAAWIDALTQTDPV
jgi:SNF2 family DNA or RNA helicase